MSIRYERILRHPIPSAIPPAMKHRPYFFTVVALLLGCALSWAWADSFYPAWWNDYGVVTAATPPGPGQSGYDAATYNAWIAQNYQPANLGQLKNFATQAQAYLNNELVSVGGAGATIDQLVHNFSTTSPADFSPVNLGQLKAVAQPFYDRLLQIGFDPKPGINFHLSGNANSTAWTGNYPWANPPPGIGQPGYDVTAYNAWVAQNYAAANLGQLKQLFSFDLTSLRPPSGFIAWASRFGLNTNDANLPNEDPAGDGVSNQAKFQANLNPTDYVYSAANATGLSLAVISGNNQQGLPGDTLPQPIVLHVAFAGGPLPNVPIHFQIMPDGGVVGVGGNLSTSGDSRTDSLGNLALNYTLGPSALQWIHFTAPTTPVAADAFFTLDATGDAGPADSPNLVVAPFLPTLDPYPIEVDPNYLQVQPTSYFDSASSALDNQVTLAWAVDNPTAALLDSTLTYLVERKMGYYGDWSVIGSVPGLKKGEFGHNDQNTAGFDFTFDDPDSLSGGHRYFYRVTAIHNHIFGVPHQATYTVPLFRDVNINLQTFVADPFFTPFNSSPPDNAVYRESYTEVDANGATVSQTLTIGTVPASGESFSGTGELLFSKITPINLYPILTMGFLSDELDGITLTPISSTNATFDNGLTGDQAFRAFDQLSFPNPWTSAQFLSDVLARIAECDPVDDPSTTPPDETFHSSTYPVGMFFSDPNAFDVQVWRSKYRVICFPTDLQVSWKIVSTTDSDLAYSDQWTILDSKTVTPDETGCTPVYAIDYPVDDQINEFIQLVPDPTFSVLVDGETLDPSEATLIPIQPGSSIGEIRLNLFPGNSFGAENSVNDLASYAKVFWTSTTQLSLNYFDSENDEYSTIGASDRLFNDYSNDPDQQTVLVTPGDASPTDADYVLTIEYYDTHDSLISSSDATFHFVFPDNSQNVSLDEVAGAQHRKVALNGRPLPDGKPQTAQESDQADEQTFIDALTLGLRHNVTDIFENVPGSDLPLGVNRVYQEETWSDRLGLRPHERPDEPFGAGWKSNLVTTARWEVNFDYNQNEDVYDITSNISDVYVTDETGNEYHFLHNSENDAFVPYPTGRHEKNPYEAVLSRDGSGLVLTKKFGATVHYAPVPELDRIFNDPANGSLIPTDRMAGDGGFRGFSFFRATSVSGRGGVGNLTYRYAGGNPLIPAMVLGTGGQTTYFSGITPLLQPGPGSPVFNGNIGTAGSRAIYIQQDENGHISDVWDSDLSHTHYTYSTVSDPASSGEVFELISVTDPENGTVQYTYQLLKELDTTPRPNSSDLSSDEYNPGTNYYHLNLASFIDQNGHSYAFDYHLHYNNGGDETTGFQSYNGFGGYFPTPGRPLLIGNVTIPSGAVTQFLNESFIRIVGGAANPAFYGDRHTVVIDVGGNRTDFHWGDGSVEIQDIPSIVAGESPVNFGELVAWGSLTITYEQAENGSSFTTLGSETFTFDKAAGMALASVEDFCGHTTSYQYTDEWTALYGYANALPGVYDNSENGYYGYYDDPTSQTDALGGHKTFTYNSLRLMSDRVDENGRLTHYQFDGDSPNEGRGLETKQLHYAGNTTDTTLLAETDYTYGNSTYKGVVTQKTTVDLDPTHPAGAGNLTVAYELDNFGRIAAQHVDPSGLDLTTSYSYSLAGDKLTQTDPRG